MAQELLRQGEEVRLLVMFDTYRPTFLRSLGLDLYYGYGAERSISSMSSAEIIRASRRLKLQLIRDLGRRKLKPRSGETGDDWRSTDFTV